MAHWPHSDVNYKSEPVRSVPHRYHITITVATMNLERYIRPPLAERQQGINMPFLCAFAPLRLCEKLPVKFPSEPYFLVSRKGAKAQSSRSKSINACSSFRRWIMTENEIASHLVCRLLLEKKKKRSVYAVE